MSASADGRMSRALARAAALAVMLAGSALADGGDGGERIVYRPPAIFGSPADETRVGGGTRGAPREALDLNVLAPLSTGLTSRERPTLYWHLSRAVSVPVEVTVVDPHATDPVLEVRLEPPFPAGVHRLSLAERGTALVPGKVYEWYVAVVHDPHRRAADTIAGATIMYRDAGPGLTAALASAPAREHAALYAREGIWYDALDALSRLIDSGSPEMRPVRAALLEQAQLRIEP